MKEIAEFNINKIDNYLNDSLNVIEHCRKLLAYGESEKAQIKAFDFYLEAIIDNQYFILTHINSLINILKESTDHNQDELYIEGYHDGYYDGSSGRDSYH